tara:strand:+ start:81 stop:749 length:669 start_codon:yes stop_codon:yes gene_type:complete
MAELKTGNFLSDWMQDRIYDTVTEDAQGKLNAGPLMGMLGGAMGYNVDAIAEQKKIDVDNKDGRNMLRQLGETRLSANLDPDADISASGVIASVRKRDEDKLTAKEDKTRGQLVADRNAGFTQQSSLVGQQIEAGQNQYLHSAKMQENRLSHTDKQNRLDRRHEMERGDKKDSLQMQIALMNNDLSEKRMEYDRETRRMDKRTALIAQLMSGLGSLGGAFSL